MVSDFIEIQKHVYTDKSYDFAISEIIDSPECNTEAAKKLLANIYFRKLNFKKSAEIAESLNDFYVVGYSFLMLGKIGMAMEFFEKAEDSPAKNWSLFFCELFADEVKHFPTYIQIRMFLERDLNLFLKLSFTEYVQKLADVSDYLCDINPETNKFFAKAFLYNDYNEDALIFLNRGLKYTTQDAEIYYLLGMCQLKENNLTEAKKYLQEAINVNKDYVPASLLLNKIQ